MGQDGFFFLERSMHEAELERALTVRGLKLDDMQRVAVLDLMRVAADAARKAGKPPGDKARPKPVVKEAPADTSPLVVRLPLRNGADFEVRESLLPRLRKSYPDVDPVRRLHQIALEWEGTPGYRPTLRGVVACLAHWFRSAQREAESTIARRANGGGGPQPGRRYEPGGRMDEGLKREMDDERRMREQAQQRTPEKRSTAAVVDGLFGPRRTKGK